MDLSLAMLELALNSLDAGATLVKISLRAGKRSVLKVTDNGGGMDADTLSRAFQSGFSTKGGNGLGLYLARREAERLGGSLKLRSKQGGGTKATFRAKGIDAGDIASSLAVLIGDGADVILKARTARGRVSIDTRRLKRELGVSLEDAAARAAVKKYVNENLK